MSSHLTDERLSALRDGALSADDAAAAERHLAGCEACRAQLAELVELEVSLAGALDHDPGEAYFATFADRVSARIAQPAPQPAVAPRRGFAAWWGSPRALAWVGSAVGLVAVAALVATLSRQHGPQEMASQVAPPSEVGQAVPAPQAAREREAAPPAAMAPGSANELSAPTPSATAAPARQAPAPLARARLETQAFRKQSTSGQLAGGKAEKDRARVSLDARAQKVAKDKSAAPEAATNVVGGDQVVMRDEANSAPAEPPPAPAAAKRLQEVRTGPSGEQLPAPHARGGAAKEGVAKLPGIFARPPATPAVTRSLAGGAQRADSPVAGATAPAFEGRSLQVRREDDGDSAAPFRLCGSVTDAQGRAIAGASVSIAETGTSMRSAADGSFCIDGARAGATLSVLAIGHPAYRAGLVAGDAGRPYAVRLAGVDALASGGRSFLGAGGARVMAMAASSAAARTKTPGAWELAAQRWAAVLPSAATEAARDEARFKVAEARVQAWRLGHADGQRAAALAATTEYLGAAPAGALRDLAEGWRRELQP